MEEDDEGVITEEEEEKNDINNNNYTIWDPNEVNTNTHLGRHEYFRRSSCSKRDEFTSKILDEFKNWILTAKSTNSPVLKTITKIKYFAQLKKVFDYFEVSHYFILLLIILKL